MIAFSDSLLRRLREASIATVLLSGSLVAQTGQFAPPASPPFKLDNVQGEWINYETQLIKPILVTSNKLVAVANEPNGTLDLFDLDLNPRASLVLGHGICSIAERRVTPGIDADANP